MKQDRWFKVAVAALVVIVGGALLALAEETIDVNVEVDDDHRTTVEVRADGAVDVFTVDDLEDGEERVFEAGDHTVTVRRAGDDIDVLLDGDELGANIDGSKIRKVVKIREGAGGEDLVWHSDDGAIEEMIVELEEHIGEGEDGEVEVKVRSLAGHPGAIFIAADDDEPRRLVTMGGTPPGMVRYRCEDTGSELLVAQEHATQPSFVDPATGCLMEKVESEDQKVVIIKKKVTVSEED